MTGRSERSQALLVHCAVILFQWIIFGYLDRIERSSSPRLENSLICSNGLLSSVSNLNRFRVCTKYRENRSLQSLEIQVEIFITAIIDCSKRLGANNEVVFAKKEDAHTTESTHTRHSRLAAAKRNIISANDWEKFH